MESVLESGLEHPPEPEDPQIPLEVLADSGQATVMEFVGEVEGEVQIVIPQWIDRGQTVVGRMVVW
jgi:hypothetical protein